MENFSFELQCNKLEGWFIKRNYNPVVVRRQILKARAFLRDTLLDTFKEVRKNDRLVLTLTYHPSIKNLQNVLNEVHILTTPKKEHCKDFGDKPMIGWRKPKSLKDYLVLKLNVNHLQIIKVCLVAGLDAKFVLLLRKLKLFKTRIKGKHLTLEKEF